MHFALHLVSWAIGCLRLTGFINSQNMPALDMSSSARKEQWTFREQCKRYVLSSLRSGTANQSSPSALG